MKDYNISPEFITEVASNPELENRLKTDPIKTLKESSALHPIEDTWVYRIVVLALGVVAVSTITYSFVLIFSGNTVADIPPIFLALGSAAVGAISGLLAPSPAKRG